MEKTGPALGALSRGGLAALGADSLGAAPLWVTALFAASYFAGASTESWERLRQGEIEIHFLMLPAAAGAALVGAWSEGALLLFLFSASDAMEHFAGARTQSEISALFRGAPKTATVLEGDAIERE